jgi:tight adherence protein C
MQLDPVELSWMVAALVALSVVFFLTSVRARRLDAQAVDARVRRYAPKRTLEEVELSEPFFERAIKPLIQRMVRIVGRLAPKRNIEDLERDLERAGRPFDLAVIDFLGGRLLVAFLFGLVMGGVVFLFKPSPRLAIFFAVAGGLVGFYLPKVWLWSRISRRQRNMERALPDALDMLVVCLDAGLGFDLALLRIAQRWRHELARELDQVVYEIRAGKPRAEALQDLVARTGVEDIATFVAVILQAEELGVSVAKVLHIHAGQMRILRRYRAEEQARQATIKMLFPLIFLIFPATLAVILGPAVPQLLSVLGGLGGGVP